LNENDELILKKTFEFIYFILDLYQVFSAAYHIVCMFCFEVKC